MSEGGEQRLRASIGLSIGDTVPVWGRGRSQLYERRPTRWFYAWANRPSEHGYGGVGLKAGFIFVRFTYGRGAK